MARALVFLTLLAASVPAMAEPVCRYAVSLVSARDRVVDVEVACPAPTNLRPSGGLPGDAVVAVEGATGNAADGWLVAGRARYRVDLERGQNSARFVPFLRQVGESLALTPSAFLLRPENRSAEIAIAGGNGQRLANALDAGGRMTVGQIPYGGFMALGRFRHQTIEARSLSSHPARVDVAILDSQFEMSDSEIAASVGDAGALVSSWYGGFPSDKALVVVLPVEGREGIAYGSVMGGGGGSVMLHLGTRAKRERLHDDWVLVHELIHVGMPFIPDGSWLMEGSATYAEPILRARHGWSRADAPWAEFVRQMPRGLGGLTRTGLARGGHTSNYWGGALFLLLADVEMRSAGLGGIEHCMRGMRGELGDTSSIRSVDEVLASCDRMSGGNVLARLVDKHVRGASPVDLDALWRDLGVVRTAEGGIAFDDAAPLASIRKAIVGKAPVSRS